MQGHTGTHNARALFVRSLKSFALLCGLSLAALSIPQQVDLQIKAQQAAARGSAFADNRCDVHIRRGQNPATVVNGAPAADKIFCIHAGFYNLGGRSIQVRDGMRLIGAPVTRSRSGAISAPTKLYSTARDGVIFFPRVARSVVISRLDISGATGSKNNSDPLTKKHGRGINGNGNAIGLIVSRSRIHHNTNAGIGGIEQGTRIVQVELDNNGTQSYLGCCAGGVKSANDYTIKQSYIHHNKGFGVWQDVCGGGFVVTNNRIVANSQGGVRYEHNQNCAGDAYIARNVIRKNNTSRKFSDGGGIIINSAPNATVLENVLGGNIGVGIEVRGNRGPVTGTEIRGNRLNGDRLKGCDRAKGVTCVLNATR